MVVVEDNLENKENTVRNKLTLGTETLRVLEDGELALAVGGGKTGKKSKCKGYGKTGKKSSCKGR